MNTITEIDIYGGCINKLRPNSQYSLYINGDNKTITWYDTGQDQPTTDEISSVRSTVISELACKLLREQRNEKLLSTDFYFVNDFPHKTDDKKNEWIIYRQELRDLLENSSVSLDEYGDITGVVWPVKPT